MSAIEIGSWQIASALLDEALDLDGLERAAWLAALRDRDPDSATLVAELLDEHRALCEERFLEASFGADYRAYKARVRRWL